MMLGLASLLASSVLPVPAQESSTVLDAPLVVVPPYRRIDLLLDWNGDGRDDLATLAESDGNIAVVSYLNDGQGGFVAESSSQHSADLIARTSQMEKVDLEGDGSEELVWVVSRLEYNVISGLMRVLRRAPSGALQRVEHLCYDDEMSIEFGTVFDADLDGDVDRVRIHETFFPRVQHLTLDLFEEGPSGTWNATTQQVVLPSLPQKMLRVDADGDAHPDLFLHYGTQGAFVSFAGGVPHAPVFFTHGIASPMPMPVAGDVDGDGDQDLAFFDMDGYALYRRTGPASWALEPRRAGGPAVRLADVDADGDLDGVCCAGSGSIIKFYKEPATFRISLNDGEGGFAPAFTIPGLGSREIAGASDLDGDGDVDLAAGQCVYYARGPLTKPPQRSLGAPQSPRTLVDFDRDGDRDFTPGLGTFPRHLGDGSTHEFTLLCPPLPAGTTEEGPGLPGDWDGDGDVDLVVRRRAAGAFSEMRLLRNEGGGSYADGGTAGTVDFLPGVEGTPPGSSFAVDLDLDGDLDLVTYRRGASGFEHWTRTWRNDGQGRFELAWHGTGSWPIGFAALHGSPAPDALLVRPLFPGSWANDVHLHPGDGAGGFAAGSVLTLQIATELGAASVALADLDQDGDVDLAGAFEFGGQNSGDGKAWFLPNVGGSLSLADGVMLEDLDRTSRGFPVPRIAQAADFDGDGRLDLLFSSPDDRRAAVSIIRRASDGLGWLPAVRQVVYPVDPGDPANVAAVAGACLDLDGDGDSDYVTDVVWTSVAHGADEWGRRRQDASGTPDGDGRVPTLGVSGVLRPGEVHVLRLTGVPAGALGTLVVSANPIDVGSRPRLGQFGALFPLTTLGSALPGAGYWFRPFVTPLSFAGLRLRMRASVLAPEAPGGVVQSNVLTLEFGN